MNELIEWLRKVGEAVAMYVPAKEKDYFKLQQAIDIAILHIRAKEARVLSEDEVKKQTGYVWKELRGAEPMSVVLIDGKMRDYDFSSGWYSYNILWRCWSAQPTDEQRKRVQWRGADGN